MDLQLQGKYLIKGKIICESGLHIGGTQEGVEIGGVDNIVIRDPLTTIPYIPGSSLKGKLRHLSEWQLNLVFPDRDDKKKFPAHSCENSKEMKDFEKSLESESFDNNKRQEEKDKKLKEFISTCPICCMFGASAGGAPTRLTVRDAFPTGIENPNKPPKDTTLWKWQNWMGENIYTELKTENSIDRVTSEANPRTMERVPAGSIFSFEIIFDIYRNQDRALLQNLFSAMHLLEDSALGGSGTRGSGRIKFQVEEVEFRSIEYYRTGKKPEQEKDEIVTTIAGLGCVKEIIEKCEPMQFT